MQGRYLSVSFLIAFAAAAENTGDVHTSSPAGALLPITGDSNAFQVTCVSDCTLSTTMHVAVGGPNVASSSPPSADIATDVVKKTGFNFTAGNWLAATFTGFKASVQLEIDYTPQASIRGSEFVYRFPSTFSWNFGQAEVATDWLVHALVKSDKAFKAQVGFDVALPDGSAFIISTDKPTDGTLAFLNPKSWTVAGLEAATFTPIPFKSSTEDLKASITLSLRPGFLLSEKATDPNNANAKTGVSFGSYPELPRLETVVSQVERADASCIHHQSSVGTTVYERLTKVATTLSVKIVQPPGKLDDHDGSVPVNRPDNVPTQWATDNKQPVGCFAFDAVKAALVDPKEGGVVAKPENGAAHRVASVSLLGAAGALLWAFIYL